MEKKQREILFNSPMALAAWEGNKSQTRRPVSGKLFTPKIDHEGNEFYGWATIYKSGYVYTWDKHGSGGENWIVKDHPDEDPVQEAFQRALKQGFIQSPFGEVGDLLYVRETVKVGAWKKGNHGFAMDYKAGNFIREEWLTVPSFEQWTTLFHRTIRKLKEKGITPNEDSLFEWEKGESPCPWIPSIHMPKWATRTWLEITGIRAERVQCIQPEEVVQEGMGKVTKDGSLYKYGMPDSDGYPGRDDYGWPWAEWRKDPVEAYSVLWNSIYGDWDQNPLVWVVDFKKVEMPQGEEK